MEQYVADCPKCGGHYTSVDYWGYCPRCRARLIVHAVVGPETVRRPAVRDKLTYTVAEVAAMMGFHRDTITRLFEKEPGVIVLARPERKHKRGYRSIRIPQNVYERVVRRLSV